MLPIQPGDVLATYADVDDLIEDGGFKPDTPIEVGISKFVEWYRIIEFKKGKHSASSRQQSNFSPNQGGAIFLKWLIFYPAQLLEFIKLVNG